MDQKNFSDFLNRAKPLGVLYVDVYPYSVSEKGDVEFLLLKRRLDVVMPGQWQPVCGKINEGERTSNAFTRQVEKKTGQPPKALYKVDYVNIFFDDYYDTVMFVPTAACEITKEIVLDESLHSEHIFVPFHQLGKYGLFDSQLKVYSIINEKLSKA